MYDIRDKSAAIKELKKYLFVLSEHVYEGISRTTIDGIYDGETTLAVKQFQKIKGLNETGVTDYETFTAIYNDYKNATNDFYARNYVISERGFPIGLGDMGEDVRTIHSIINELRERFSDVIGVGTGSYYSVSTVGAVRRLREIFGMERSDFIDKLFYNRLITELEAHRRADKKHGG